MQQLHWGKGEEETMETKKKNEVENRVLLARPGWLHNAASGQRQRGGRGFGLGNPRMQRGSPSLPSSPLSNLVLQRVLESPTQSAELDGETKTPGQDV